VTIVRQRGDADCGCAALSTYLEEPYEDCYLAVSKVDKRHRGKNGLHNREVIAAAKLMGVTLVPTRSFDLDEDEGILRVRWNDKKKRKGGHFVCVIGSRICCPSDGVPVDWKVYLQRNNARLGTLLKEVG
jgi:hypothetical protein